MGKYGKSVFAGVVIFVFEILLVLFLTGNLSNREHNDNDVANYHGYYNNY